MLPLARVEQPPADRVYDLHLPSRARPADQMEAS
jgi:hypothetical protein